ncbi:Uncharacterized protein APZ42_027852 [Daphnia magna]|uniref:Uncharacterized protein n=1 Tax=Daphnia magna TaxID=35525 RepID=A0A164R121_9CRUS|nr:Uncharacterized protein APZ42_027852 [Daphnia magna]
MYRKKLSVAQNRAQTSKKVKESEKNKQTLKDLGWFTTPPSKPNEIESGEESETCNQESETSYLEKAENVDESIILSKSDETHGSERDDAA